MATVVGTVGNDNLAGTVSADTMSGLAGNDTYTVNHCDDVVIEGAAAGTDTVNSSVSFVLGANVENLTLSGTAALDGTGNDLNNILTGNGGPNKLVAGDGIDTVKGGSGDDVLVFDSYLTTDDRLDGGIGNDTLRLNGDYSAGIVFGATTMINVERIELATGNSYSFTLNNATNATSLTIDAAALGAGDTLSVNGAAETTNSLIATGGAGSDTLIGGGGNDVLAGGAAGDVLTGGLGIDAVSYADSAVGVTVDLNVAGAQGGAGDAAGDVLSGIENIIGSVADDTLTGTAGANKLEGGAGDDVLVSGAGNDTLLGGDGDDTLNLGANWTTADKIDGGDGDDTLLLQGNYAAGLSIGYYNIERITLGAGFDYKLTLSDAANIGGFTVDGSALAAGDNLTVNGAAELLMPLVAIGGGGDDVLTGGKAADILTAGTGTDTLIGNAGSDLFVLEGGLNATDRIDGGTELDILRLDGDYSAGVAFNATTVLNIETIELVDGNDYNLTLNNATNAAGLKVDATALSAGSDLILNGAAETTSTLTALGGAGDDTLIGGGGNDFMVGGAGGDTMNGGAGNDTVSYADASAQITVDLTTPGNNAGDAAGDQISNVEIILGSNYGDTLSGNASANQLNGGLGDDILSGGGGNDILVGGTGNDTFAEGVNLTALDKLDGGVGQDILQLSASSTYATGLTFGTTTLINVETIELGDGNNYKLTLNNATNTGGLTVDGSALTGANSLTLVGSTETESTLTATGGAGADSLTGGGASDLFEGGAGADKLIGGAGNDTASYAGSAAGVTVNLALATAQISGGDAAGDILSTIENLRGSDHDDTLTGNSGANMLTGGLGADTMSGGAGIDLVSYVSSVAGVTIDLTLDGIAQASAGEAAGDILAADIEGVVGSSFDDILLGDANANVLEGGVGDDTISAGAGIDTLTGGAGQDHFLLAGNLAATDKIDGGTDTDTLVLTANAAYATGITFTATTMVNIEEIDLSDGNKYRFTFSDANNTGGLFVDGSLLTGTNSLYLSGATELSAALTAIGGTAADTLIGGGGNDVFDGGAGGDTLTGGNGIDAVTYATSAAGVTVDLNLIAAQVSGGTASGDRLSGIEIVIGSDSADILTGDAKNNGLDGGLGDDILKGGAGADILIGGAGTDTALYTGSTLGVSVDLQVTGTQGGVGDAAGDILSGIENLTGSAFNDVMQGDDAANILLGGNGNDVLTGDGGADTIDGGAGIDTASYVSSESAVTVDLANNGNNAGGDAAGDILTAIENVIGSSLSDTLVGNALANILDGGSGVDTLSGGDGNDTLLGGADVDTLDAGSGNDIIFAGTGDDKLLLGSNLTALDKLDGGTGKDTLNLSGSAIYAVGVTFSTTTLVNTETIALSDGNSYKLTLSNATNTFGQILSETNGVTEGGMTVNGSLLTGANALTLIASAETESAYHLIGGGAGDVLTSGGGNDLLEGAAGADKLTGGAGIDTATYENSNAGVTVNLSLVTAQVSAGDAAGDVLATIENLRGSALGDTLTGNTAANMLDGGLGADTLDGGAGNDTANYARATGGQTVNLADSSQNAGNQAAGDILVNIENVIGTDYNDHLTGDGNNNVLTGGAGDDTLKGGAGNDTLFGGSGSDSLTAGTGNDTLRGDAGGDAFYLEGNLNALDNIDGGAGSDALFLTASAAYAGTGVSFSATTLVNTEVIVLGDGNSYKLTLSNATNTSKLTVDGSALTGTNAMILSGAAEIESTLVAIGGAGADVITGGGAADDLTGGIGADKLTGGGGNDLASYSSSAAGVTVNLSLTTAQISAGDASGDILATIENLQGSTHDDTLTGNSGANVLIGGLGADTLNGGAGNDTASYAFSAAVVVDLTDNTNNSGGEAAGDVLIGIENITGSLGADTLIGDGNANVLDGSDGDDTLVAGCGNDTLLGGKGNDTLDLDDELTALDKISGGTGVDLLLLDGNYSLGVIFTATTMQEIEQIDLADGNSYNFTLHDATNGGELIVNGAGLTGFNRLLLNGASEGSASLTAFGGAGADTLIGGGGRDVLVGGDGADTLTGGSGGDRLDGGSGNDTLTGGAGSDFLAAGSGIDTMAAGDDSDVVTMGAYLTSADRIDGGTGDDAITLDGDYAGGISFGTATMVNVETLLLADGNSYRLTLNNANNTTGLLVDGSNLTGANTLIVNGSAETLSSLSALGGAGDDELTGGAGNDLLNGGAGADKLVGGLGNDTVSYGGATAGVTIDLTLATAQISGSDASGDVLSSIENVIGSNKNDSLTGNAAANILTGGAGADTINGGAGIDTADYAGSNAAVTVDLGNNANNAGGHAAGDLLSNIENLIGSAFGDTLSGDANVNILTGGDGNDSLSSLAGNDSLFGGTGNDLLRGGTGGDVIDGGDGSDTVSYAGSTAAVTVDLTLSGVQSSGGDAAGDKLASIENVIGTAFKDQLIGNSGDNILEGGGGADVVNGSGGNDTASYASSAAAVTVNLALLTAQISTGDASGDVLSGIENLIGSANADTLTGDANINTLNGGAGADKLNGAGGVDTASYAGSAVGVTVNLANLGVQTSAGDAAGDILSNIENLLGSANADVLTGDSLGNALDGGAGNDTLSGAGGIDTLSGSAGDDILIGGSGADSLFGGDGNDTASYASSTVGVTINLTKTTQVSAGDASGDNFSSIENVIGSAFKDVLTGSFNNNVLEGGGGADTIDGGVGSDTASYASSGSAVLVDLFDNSNNSGGDASGDLLLNIENLLGSIHGDTLTGNTGNNILTGGLGADTLNGGLGTDTVSYVNSTAVTVDLNDDSNNAGGEAAGDQFLDIENATGSAFADQITGSIDANTLDGGDGADTINGGDGNDILLGGSGDDTLFGGLDDDILRGGIGNDTLSGDGGSDIFVWNKLDEVGDTVADFSAGLGGDSLDIGDLLVGFDENSSDATDFVRFVASGGDTILEVDINGAIGGANFVSVATLTNVAGADVDTYIANENLILI